MHTLVAYVPVLHEGYRQFFESVDGEKELFILDSSLTAEFAELRKEIRQLEPELMTQAVRALDIFSSVGLLTSSEAATLNKSAAEIIMPDEEVSRVIAERYLPLAKVTFSSIFLRWDKHNALKEKPVVPEERITREALHQRLMGIAENESKKSSDNWRHVGGLVSREGVILLQAHNTHLPSEHTPYVNGDPRSSFHKGDHIEFSSALHAEAGLVSEAARRGIALEGCDMYVTVFPCPPCAKLIANAGIKNLYCAGGYGVLDGEAVLKSKGVTIRFVE